MKKFGVPLNGKGSMVLGGESFDNAVGSYRVHYELTSNLVDDLVVQAVHRYVKFGAVDVPRCRTCDAPDHVSGNAAINVPLRMSRTEGQFDVLTKRAAVRHVDELKAPADTEDGNSPSASRGVERKFPLITLILHRPQIRIGGRPVTRRVEVGTAGEYEAIKTGDHFLSVGVTSELDRQTAGFRHRRRVIRHVQVKEKFSHGRRHRVTKRADGPAASRNTNKGACHVSIVGNQPLKMIKLVWI